MRHLLLALLLCFSSTVLLAKGPSGTISIEADQAQLDQNSGDSRYSGNVVIRQGGLLIRASNAEVSTTNNKLSQVVVTGKPLSWSYEQPGKTAIHGTCWKGVYQPTNKSITLTDKVRIRQGEKTFQGARIVYHLTNGTIQADGGAKSRVKLVIPPSR